jgi:hypothetical protein
MHKDCCLYFEENIAWFIGWIDGVFIGCVFFNEDNEECLEQDYAILSAAINGGKKGYVDVSKIKRIDK